MEKQSSELNVPENVDVNDEEDNVSDCESEIEIVHDNNECHGLDNENVEVRNNVM